MSKAQTKAKFVGLQPTLDSVFLEYVCGFHCWFWSIGVASPWFSQNISENDDIRFIIPKQQYKHHPEKDPSDHFDAPPAPPELGPWPLPPLPPPFERNHPVSTLPDPSCMRIKAAKIKWGGVIEGLYYLNELNRKRVLRMGATCGVQWQILINFADPAIKISSAALQNLRNRLWVYKEDLRVHPNLVR